MKVGTLSNHLEYHWDPKDGKNHKIGLLQHHPYDGKMTRMTFPSTLVASMAYRNDRHEKLGRLRDFPTT